MVEFSRIAKKVRRPEDEAGVKKETPQAKQPVNDALPEAGEEYRFSAAIRPLFTKSKEPLPAPALKADVPKKATVSSGASVLDDPLFFYQKMVALAKAVLKHGVNYEEFDSKPLVDIVAEAAARVGSDDDKLVELAVTHIIKEEESYLFQHVVNVCILSLLIGKGLNYEKDKMIELGLSAFLHDIGMTAYENMVQLPRRLTPQEYEEIKNHVQAGDRILRSINPGLSETILIAQSEIHERLDGSGYPTGKRDIHDYARIIALVDAFESLIHPRPFRPSHSLMEVYKRIFDAKNKYDQNFIKVMIDRIGFFPTGSYVQLNTREVGRVILQNPKSPLRPVVKIVMNVDGRKMDEAGVKEFDLTKYPTIHIKKCFLELETAA